MAKYKPVIFRKPRAGASLDDHNRYVVEKYIRRKFVGDKNAADPLTEYKSGKSPQPERKQ
jgi:hypothetical protein